jgi:hypothetical protein
MAISIAYRIAGPTYALSVTASAHAAVAITDTTNDLTVAAEFINRGATDICVAVSELSATGAAQAVTLVFPVDGTPTVPASFILPAGMTQPIVKTVPSNNNGFSITAIGSGAGPSIMYVTPISLMS